MADVFNISKWRAMTNYNAAATNGYECALFTASPTSPLTTGFLNYDNMTALLADTGNWTEASDATYTSKGTTGRIALTGVTVKAVNDTADRAELDCNDITYATLNNFTIQGVVIYRSGGTAGPTGDGAHEPITYYDTNQPTNGGDIVITIGADGFFWIG